MKQPTRGFTLLELLVAMSIIGLLTAITIAALNYSKARGNDTAMESNLNTIRQEAEFFYSTNNSYNLTGSTVTHQGTGCSNATDANTLFADTTIQNALKAVANLNNAGATTNIDCGVAAYAYSFAISLTAAPNTYWCIDNAGYSTSKSKAYNQPYTALTGVCTSAANCAAHASAGATVCQ